MSVTRLLGYSPNWYHRASNWLFVFVVPTMDVMSDLVLLGVFHWVCCLPCYESMSSWLLSCWSLGSTCFHGWLSLVTSGTSTGLPSLASVFTVGLPLAVLILGPVPLACLRLALLGLVSEGPS